MPRNNLGIAWTPERLEWAIARLRGGTTPTQLADELGLRGSSLWSAFKRAGAKGPKHYYRPREDEDEAHEPSAPREDRAPTTERLPENGGHKSHEAALVAGDSGPPTQRSVREPSVLSKSPPERAQPQVEQLDAIEEHKLRKTGRRLQSENRDLLRQLEVSEERQRVLDELEHQRPAYRIVRREKTSGLREATAVALASDWHVEEPVFLHQTAGRNAYNLAIADLRVRRFFEGIRWLIEADRGRFVIRDLVLWLGGDLFSGYIHEELLEANPLSPTEALLWLRERITAGIRYLLDDPELAHIQIVCNYGNHGRTTLKSRVSTGAKNSYEWLLYHNAAADFEGDERVTFQIANGAHEYLDVYDRTLHFHHGDEVRFQGGIGGLSIPLHKRVARWNEIRQSYLHIIGHYHQFRDYALSVCNGSLIGLNAYAIKVGAGMEDPQQGFFLLDSKRGKTQVAPIWVSDLDEEAPMRSAAA